MINNPAKVIATIEKNLAQERFDKTYELGREHGYYIGLVDGRTGKREYQSESAVCPHCRAKIDFTERECVECGKNIFPF